MPSLVWGRSGEAVLIEPRALSSPVELVETTHLFRSSTVGKHFVAKDRGVIAAASLSPDGVVYAVVTDAVTKELRQFEGDKETPFSANAGACATHDHEEDGTSAKQATTLRKPVLPDILDEDLIFHGKGSCYSNDNAPRFTRYYKVDVVLAKSMEKMYGSELVATHVTERAINASNAVWDHQFNFTISVRVVRPNEITQGPDNTAMDACRLPTYDYLDALRFCQYPGKEDADHVHLFVGCPSIDPQGQVIGIAYLGTMCRLRPLNIGVSAANSKLAHTFMHEMGHGLNAGHTFYEGWKGGIMDYGNGLVNGEIRFIPPSGKSICKYIEKSCKPRTLDPPTTTPTPTTSAPVTSTSAAPTTDAPTTSTPTTGTPTTSTSAVPPTGAPTTSAPTTSTSAVPTTGPTSTPIGGSGGPTDSDNSEGDPWIDQGGLYIVVGLVGVSCALALLVIIRLMIQR